MKQLKRLERSGKRFLRAVLKNVINSRAVDVGTLYREPIAKILLVRQDSRLGNLVLMTPLIAAVKTVFPACRLDVLVSEGFENVIGHNPYIDRIIVFRKQKTRMAPWQAITFLRALRRERYDLSVDVSDGSHFSFNNVLMTALSGARIRLGYNREDAGVFLNCLAPPPPEQVHMAEALTGLLRFCAPNTPELPLRFDVTSVEREFADDWLKTHTIGNNEPLIVIHPGGRGKKQWGAKNFAELVARMNREIGGRIVIIGGAAEARLIEEITGGMTVPVSVLQNVTVGQMAAVIEKCGLFVSNDTGPMHVASALERPTVGIFITSDHKKYGPRGGRSRAVFAVQGKPTVDDVMIAIFDVLGR